MNAQEAAEQAFIIILITTVDRALMNGLIPPKSKGSGSK
jgi:hypothetical protein